MPAPVHPGRLLRRELKARELSANRLALDLGVPSGRITGILNERRWISADTAFRLGRYFGNRRNSGSTFTRRARSRAFRRQPFSLPSPFAARIVISGSQPSGSSGGLTDSRSSRTNDFRMD